MIPISSPRRRRRARPEWEGRSLITVGALPGRSLHVKHLGHPEGVDGVHRPTVLPPGSARRSGGAFDPRWFAVHLADVDVVDVEAVPTRMSPEDVAKAADMVRESGTPLVVTAYHLTDPTGAAPVRYGAQWDALIPRADAVVTVTDSAAAEIRRRWGVEALVLPHPHAVDFVRMRQDRSAGRADHLRVGAHLGSLRGAVEPFVTALAEAVSLVPGAQLRVYLHDHVLDPESSRYDVTRARELERTVREVGGVLRAHRPLTDSQLWDQLFGLDVAVVPPLDGSHSVLPEACYDLGTQIVLPAGSHAASQQSCLEYVQRVPRASRAKNAAPRPPGATAAQPDAASLTAALTSAATTMADGGAPRATPTARWEERLRISEGYRTLYERLLAG